MTSNAQDDFAERIERHRALLAKAARAYCRNAANREDLIQEMLVALWRAYPRFDGRARFSTWAYRIAVNVAISFYRREQRAGAETTAPAELERRPAERPHDESRTGERLGLAIEFLDRLDELNRAPMLLYLEEVPYAEIASVLGISETNVATTISRLKQRLRREVAAKTAAANGDDRGD